MKCVKDLISVDFKDMLWCRTTHAARRETFSAVWPPVSWGIRSRVGDREAVWVRGLYVDWVPIAWIWRLYTTRDEE